MAGKVARDPEEIYDSSDTAIKICITSPCRLNRFDTLFACAVAVVHEARAFSLLRVPHPLPKPAVSEYYFLLRSS